MGLSASTALRLVCAVPVEHRISTRRQRCRRGIVRVIRRWPRSAGAASRCRQRRRHGPPNPWVVLSWCAGAQRPRAAARAARHPLVVDVRPISRTGLSVCRKIGYSRRSATAVIMSTRWRQRITAGRRCATFCHPTGEHAGRLEIAWHVAGPAQGGVGSVPWHPSRRRGIRDPAARAVSCGVVPCRVVSR
jgi:hypothetical protein